MLKNALSALYLQNGWMDFNHTCRYNSLRDGKNLLDFGDLDLIFKITRSQRMLKHAWSSLYLLKGLIDQGQT